MKVRALAETFDWMAWFTFGLFVTNCMVKILDLHSTVAAFACGFSVMYVAFAVRALVERL